METPTKKRIGALVFNLTVSTDKLVEGFKRLREAVVSEKRYLYRNDFWKRSEPPPDWIADVAEPEWWNGGDEPPEWWCAA